MRRLLASATLVVLGLSLTAYADDARSFTQEQLRADAHKQARTTLDDNDLPVARVADQQCANGVAGTTAFACEGVDLLSFVPLTEIGGAKQNGGLQRLRSDGVSDLWGWVDPEPNAAGVNDEYVIMGKTNGVALFRITDPSNPEFLGQIPNNSPQQLVWHDIKVFKDHAFIVSESVQHGMNVFDLTRLRDVTAAAPQTFKPDTNYPTAFAAHNIAINEETGFAYIVGGNTGLVVPDHCLSGLHMIDINDPKNPKFAGCHLTGEGRGTAASVVGLVAEVPESPVSYIHDTQCVVYRGPDADYEGRELCFNSSEDHMSIVDVTNKLLPRQVALVTYPETAYAHQGWLTADQTHFLMGDELDEGDTAELTRTVVFDVTDIDKARFVGVNEGETAAIDHNMYEKNGLFYQSNYAAGLRIVDSSGLTSGGTDATLPQVAFFDTFPLNDDPTFNGTWSNFPYFPSGTIAVSGIDEGLFLLKVQDSVLEQFETAPAAGGPADAAASGLARAEQAKSRSRKG